jgi:hypothetical protein
MSYNTAVGNGGNPPEPETPGGGSGGAVFFVSNDRTGHLIVEDSGSTSNMSMGFETPGYSGIFYLGDGDPIVSNSTID